MLTAILQFKLTILARLTLWKYRPRIVAITGNVGKTSTKEAVALVLAQKFSVRANGGNLNNQLGIPATILGADTERYYREGGSFGFWTSVIWHGFLGLLVRRPYPEVLVLEYGADHPGDISALTRAFRPDIGVITAIGEVPSHVVHFKTPQALADEKAMLIRGMTNSQTAILGVDDPIVADLARRTKARIVTYGHREDSHFKISNLDITYDEHGRPQGITFKLHYGSSLVPVRLFGSLGMSQALAACAAAAVASRFDINLLDVSQALGTYQGPAGRLRILEGIHETTIIDDTYNASPRATQLALETLGHVRATRRIAVLGDMLELGQFSESAHRAIGQQAGQVVDRLIGVGLESKHIVSESGLPSDRAQWYPDARSAAAALCEILQPGDVILVKGSQGMRMERVVAEIMAQPAQHTNLLVRQSLSWLAKG